MVDEHPNLLSEQGWPQLMDAIDSAALLVVIERRMGSALSGKCEAQDILQDALLQAWRARGQFEWRGLKSFRAWLLTIIDNRIVDERTRLLSQMRDPGRERRAESTHASSTISESLDFPAGSTTPSMISSSRETAEVMRRTLRGLPDELREVVYLRHFEQLELESIGSRLGLGVSAVRHRFRKGSELYLQRLRTALGST